MRLPASLQLTCQTASGHCKIRVILDIDEGSLCDKSLFDSPFLVGARSPNSYIPSLMRPWS